MDLMARIYVNLDLTLSNNKVYTYTQTKIYFRESYSPKSWDWVSLGDALFCFVHFQNIAQKHESYFKYQCHALKTCISNAWREKYATYKTL